MHLSHLLAVAFTGFAALAVARPDLEDECGDYWVGSEDPECDDYYVGDADYCFVDVRHIFYIIFYPASYVILSLMYTNINL